mmetsp:Transcript_39059/g.57367  ORF Transcript_39059/g.57367 Transcript_39059/m.57367 type:complete len:85 (+) Transcript_39059:1197-1451(+)
MFAKTIRRFVNICLIEILEKNSPSRSSALPHLSFFFTVVDFAVKALSSLISDWAIARNANWDRSFYPSKSGGCWNYYLIVFGES